MAPEPEKLSNYKYVIFMIWLSQGGIVNYGIEFEEYSKKEKLYK